MLKFLPTAIGALMIHIVVLSDRNHRASIHIPFKNFPIGVGVGDVLSHPILTRGVVVDKKMWKGSDNSCLYFCFVEFEHVTELMTKGLKDPEVPSYTLPEQVWH